MQNQTDPASWTLRQASEQIRARKISPVELTQACLGRIDTFNPKTNAFITVMKEQALVQAKALEKEPWRGPLHGIPIALKDNIDAVGVRTTAGSKTLSGNIATSDAEATRRLRAAGAVLIGKCNMHIFASGATSAVSYYGPVRNPWNLERIAGGSSGGSAAAVATDNCYAALGTDTGGSIRTPSAMCGVTGFKATYGRVSIRGIVPLTWSLDHCGPIARTVEDAALVLQVIAGYDRLDLQSVDYPVPDYTPSIGAPVAQFRLGISPQFYDGLEPDVASAMEAALAQLSKLTKAPKKSKCRRSSAPALTARAVSTAKISAVASFALKPMLPIPPPGEAVAAEREAEAVDAPSTTSMNGAPCASSAAWSMMTSSASRKWT